MPLKTDPALAQSLSQSRVINSVLSLKSGTKCYYRITFCVFIPGADMKYTPDSSAGVTN